MPHYLIDTLFVTQDAINGQIRTNQSWYSTTTDKSEALQQFEQLRNDLTCIAAALTEWTPGSQGGTITHQSWSDRSCTGGVPTQTVIRQADRSFAQSDKCYQSLDDWTVEIVSLPVSTQPAPGFTLRPRVLDDRTQSLMLRPHPNTNDEGRYKINHTENGYPTFTYCAAEDLPKHQHKPNFEAQLITYSDADKATLQQTAHARTLTR